MHCQKAISTLFLLLIWNENIARAEEMDAVPAQSFHAGFMYPGGVDLAGYSVEEKFQQHLYRYYTLGMPSIAAIGLSYYQAHQGNGWTATAGVGIGFVMYASAAYQLKIDTQHYFKFGAGLAAGVAYSGLIPVLSYEYRFVK